MSDAVKTTSLAGRLRRHARRCRNEKGYKPLDDMTRTYCSNYLRSLAQLVDVDRHAIPFAKSTLKILDRRNPP